MPTLPDDVAEALLSLFPQASARGGWAMALEWLLTAEQERRGVPERVSGALHAEALTHGSLLKSEYDHSLHAHIGFELDALVVDFHRFIRFNDRYGFPFGDRLLAGAVAALSSQHPRGKVVRIHTDAFALLFPPFSETRVDPALEERTLAALHGALRPLIEEAERTVRDGGAPRPELQFTSALLSLRVENPSHWQLLGPLVWAECERALTLAKRTEARGVLKRRFDLAGSV